MKSINHFKQNRPVHLARRDVYFERAAELIFSEQSVFSPEVHIKEYEEILFLLRVARQHAQFSIREFGENEKDEQFVGLINLLAGNVKAILSMLNLKNMVELSEDSGFSFLGENQASVALQAEEHQRRANDIVRSVHNTLQLAEEPFQQLKEENANDSEEEDMERYSKAREHFLLLVQSGRHRYRIVPDLKSVSKF